MTFRLIPIPKAPRWRVLRPLHALRLRWLLRPRNGFVVAVFGAPVTDERLRRMIGDPP